MKKKQTDPYISDLMCLMDNSPTAWHAVENIKHNLVDNGFEELHEQKRWELKPSKKYFTTRNGSSLIAFVTPKKKPENALIAAAHTDSPSLKLKPNSEFLKENMVMLGLVYG